MPTRPRRTCWPSLRGQPISAAGPLLSQRAYSTGVTQLSRDVASEMPAWARAEPDAIRIVELMRPRSAIATPLLAGQDPLGVIVLTRGAQRPPFTATDVSMVEELGRRLGVGLANTDTFTREHVIAETLQRSLLPDALPRSQGLTSRSATCPLRRERPSAATGTTRSPSPAAGSGW